MWHIIQLHWMGAPLGGGKFDPHHAASSAAVALQPVLVALLYAIGIISTVYHFANGLWSLGITWGLWTSPAAMRRANWLSLIVGLGLGGAGLGALVGMRSIDVDKAREIETRMDRARQVLEGDAAHADASESGGLFKNAALTGGRSEDLSGTQTEERD
jgi:succinate dehydrogenase / fumarate reductase cytochrome b subunit